MPEKPHNQNEQTEKWLEEYARRRQGELGVPLEMHNATREMLQGEVRRQYGTNYDRATRETADSNQSAGIPWLGWAFGAAAVGAVAFLVTLNPSQPAGTQPVDMAKVQPGTAPAENDRQTQPAAGIAETVENPGRFKAAQLQPGKARMAPAGVASANSVPGSPGAASAEVQAIPVKPPRVVGRPDVVRLPNAYYNNLRELRQEFAQTDAKNEAVADAKNALPKPVLVQFHVERNGNDVRVIDGDGSVYTGTVINEEEFVAAKTTTAANANKPEAADPNVGALAAPPVPKPVAPSAPAIAPAVAQVRAIPVSAPRGQFYFRASGTNKTLRKRVVIEATFDHPRASKAKKDLRDRRANAGANVPKSAESKKPTISAVHAIARMRVLGNARIENANYRVDAYQEAAPAKPAEPVEPNKVEPINKAGKKE